MRGFLVLAVSLCVASEVLAQALDPGAFGSEYAAIGYTNVPTHNPMAALESRLERGEIKLSFSGERRHLDDLLAKLDIDPASQVLVYSRTSVQLELISAATPRAIYFNDSTYVAWVPGTTMLEIATIDTVMGPVFYVLHGERDRTPVLRRHTGTCLVCHDAYGGGGGGTPRLLVQSVDTGLDGRLLGQAIEVTDATPLADRWGGWYVTGDAGARFHRGAAPGAAVTQPYLASTSDIVALLVLEHQVTAQNQITYVAYKASAVLRRTGQDEAKKAKTWDELPERAKRLLEPMMKKLADALTGADAPNLEGRIAAGSPFVAGFEQRALRASNGRSLRDLDLQSRLFRYPVSYLIHSAEFKALPGYAKDYVRRAAERQIERLESKERDEFITLLNDVEPGFLMSPAPAA